MVERAVGLQVADRRTGLLGDRRERADLVGDLLAQHLERDVAGHAAEVLTVGVGHLRPDRDPASSTRLISACAAATRSASPSAPAADSSAASGASQICGAAWCSASTNSPLDDMHRVGLS